MASTRNLTVLLTDIKGFTDKTSRKSRSDIQALLDHHKEIVLPTLQKGGGSLIKTIGDAFLMVFESPTDAVLAGVSVQDALRQYNEGKPEDDRIEIRVAINAGEVNLADNDVFGEPVNITARINAIAEAGEVFFTEAVYLAMNKNEVPSSEVGLLQLKGIREKIRVYKVRREQAVGAEAPAATGLPHKNFWGALKGNLLGTAPLPAGPAGKPAPPKRRAMALLIDFLLCQVLLGALIGKGSQASVTVRQQQGERAVGAQGPTGAGLELGQKGLKITDGKDEVSVGKGGFKIKSRDEDAGAAADADDADESSEVDTQDDGGGRKKKAFPLIWLLYSTFFLALWQTTPGGRILRLQVVPAAGGIIDWKLALARSLMTVVSASVAMLGFAWALWDKERRGWHDIIAGTAVVEKP